MEALHPCCRWRKEGALPVGTGETSWQRRQAGFTEQRGSTRRRLPALGQSWGAHGLPTFHWLQLVT